MPETSRDRIAYWFWCVKNGQPKETMLESENVLLRPLDKDRHYARKEQEMCYEAAERYSPAYDRHQRRRPVE